MPDTPSNTPPNTPLDNPLALYPTSELFDEIASRATSAVLAFVGAPNSLHPEAITIAYEGKVLTCQGLATQIIAQLQDGLEDRESHGD